MNILPKKKRSPLCQLISLALLMGLTNIGFGCGKAQPLYEGSTDTNTDTDSDADTDTDSDTDFDTETETIQDGKFIIAAWISSSLGTVGIVEWSINIDPLESAHIEFGLDTDYGMSAPVDLNEPNLRTYLLGMKPSRKYHFRIVASNGTETFNSNDHTLDTGPVSNFLPQKDVATLPNAPLAGGFILSCTYVESQVFILDSDGDYVWWALPKAHRCSRARMSYDGKQVLIRDVNVNDNEGSLLKINLEGEVEENMHISGSHHDFTVLPDETIGFIFFDDEESRCDDIVEMSPDGVFSTIFHLADIITPPDDTDGCHSNSIHYHEQDDSYTISVLNTNQYIKVTRSGELVWILGGNESSFEGAAWYRQHGHQILDNGNILLFNNGSLTDQAIVLEYSLDESIWQASHVWDYVGGHQSMILGDVQRLPNGNTLVVYSSDEVIHEVDSTGELLRNTTFTMAGGLAYAMWRDSLYGPPPK